MHAPSTTHHLLKRAALSGIFLLILGSGLAFGQKAKLSFEDTFTLDDSRLYEIKGGDWTYDISNKRFAMASVLKRANEKMWAIRSDVTVPRAFIFEADYTSSGKDETAALGLKNPETGDHVLAAITLKNDEIGGWSVMVWITYSYTEAPFGFHQQIRKKMTQPPLAGSTFHLSFTRKPGSDNLEFFVENIDLGMLETSLAPDSTNVELENQMSRPLTPSWIEALNGMTSAGLFGYGATCEGAWDNIRLKSLD